MLYQLPENLNHLPNFRKKQIHHAIWGDYISEWSDATTLPKDLLKELEQSLPINIAGENFHSTDQQTCKTVIELEDEKKIEPGLMQHKDDRNTICLSTQVGCVMNCSYCATGQMGFSRNLTADEIIMQILFWARYLKKSKRKITNVVFMGMGEPFLNYDNVMKSISIINSPDFFNIGARRISISTCGITEGIKKLANQPLQINLAISLHAPNDKVRNQIMTINKKYSVNKIMVAVDQYVTKTNRKVMFEYLLLKDVNDKPEHARELATLLDNHLYMVNLVKYNPSNSAFSPTPINKFQKFKSILQVAGINVTERHSFGQDIKAACGQLANK